MSGTATRSEWSAFGTGAVLCTTDPRALADARRAVEQTLAAVARACNRFDPQSELARVNALSGRTVRVSSLLGRAIAVALEVAAATDGAVDPTVGTSLEAAGYDRDYEAIVSTQDAAAFVPAGGWRAVRFDEASGSLEVPGGVKLDLGSAGKAMAVDMAAGAAADAGGCGVLFSLGGDMRVAGAPPSGGWLVHVTDDHAAGASAHGQTVTIATGALATSSTLVRRWRRREAVHHILDPATGAPAQEIWCTASVAASTCVDANAQATAAIVRGREAVDRLTTLRVPARLRSRTRGVRHLGGWPEAGDSQCGPGT